MGTPADMGSFKKSLSETRRLEEIIPGGAHTYARGADQYPAEAPIVIERGAGCEVWDVDGNRFIEYGMGLRSVILGHGYPAITEAALKAMTAGCSFVRPSHYELACAERMLSLVPTMDMVKFAKNGSDVTTAAIKLARAATGRDHIAVCQDHPFFSTDDWFICTTPMSAGIPACVAELTDSFPYGDLEALQDLLLGGSRKYACVILEPEKYDLPPAGYLKGVREICDRAGACLVFDEMITGFRHYVGGVHLREGVRPDLVTYGKSIGNGFSNSALMGRRELMRLGGFDHDESRVFLLSTTHGGETHALAATIATLDVLVAEDVLTKIEHCGRLLTDGIDQIVGELGLDGFFGVRGVPTDLVYVTNNAEGAPSQEFRTLFLQETIRRGILAPSFVLSYSHTSQIIESTLDVLREVLKVYSLALETGPDRYLAGRPVKPAVRQRR